MWKFNVRGHIMTHFRDFSTHFRQITHSKQHFCTQMESEFFGIWGANFVLFHFLRFWACVLSRTLPTLPEVCPQIICLEIARAYTKNVSHSWSHFIPKHGARSSQVSCNPAQCFATFPVTLRLLLVHPVAVRVAQNESARRKECVPRNCSPSTVRHWPQFSC